VAITGRRKGAPLQPPEARKEILVFLPATGRAAVYQLAAHTIGVRLAFADG
jgi:hypothetical protein